MLRNHGPCRISQSIGLASLQSVQNTESRPPLVFHLKQNDIVQMIANKIFWYSAVSFRVLSEYSMKKAGFTCFFRFFQNFLMESPPSQFQPWLFACQAPFRWSDVQGILCQTKKKIALLVFEILTHLLICLWKGLKVAETLSAGRTPPTRARFRNHPMQSKAKVTTTSMRFRESRGWNVEISI